MNISPVFREFFRVFTQWYFLWPLLISDSYLEYFVLHRPKNAEIFDQIGEDDRKLLRFTPVNCNAAIWPKIRSFSKIFSGIVTKGMVSNPCKFQHYRVNIKVLGDFWIPGKIIAETSGRRTVLLKHEIQNLLSPKSPIKLAPNCPIAELSCRRIVWSPNCPSPKRRRRNGVAESASPKRPIPVRTSC